MLPANSFRANVAAAIRNSQGQFLALERSDRPGIWQFPQGGIGVEEEPIDGIFREIREEIGLNADHLSLIAVSRRWFAYELPRERWESKFGRGQVQKWFLMEFIGKDEDIRSGLIGRLDFKCWEWVQPTVILGRVEFFKYDLYQDVFDEFGVRY